MCVDEMHPALRGHLVDDGQVPVRIVQDGARLDALARDLHGVVVGQQRAGIVRRVAEVRGRHQPSICGISRRASIVGAGEVAAAGDVLADVVEARYRSSFAQRGTGAE